MEKKKIAIPMLLLCFTKNQFDLANILQRATPKFYCAAQTMPTGEGREPAISYAN